eukprot:1161105-Pelagomonas_calceolata.AAC.15
MSRRSLPAAAAAESAWEQQRMLHRRISGGSEMNKRNLPAAPAAETAWEQQHTLHRRVNGGLETNKRNLPAAAAAETAWEQQRMLHRRISGGLEMNKRCLKLLQQRLPESSSTCCRKVNGGVEMNVRLLETAKGFNGALKMKMKKRFTCSCCSRDCLGAAAAAAAGTAWKQQRLLYRRINAAAAETAWEWQHRPKAAGGGPGGMWWTQALGQVNTGAGAMQLTLHDMCEDFAGMYVLASKGAGQSVQLPEKQKGSETQEEKERKEEKGR